MPTSSNFQSSIFTTAVEAADIVAVFAPISKMAFVVDKSAVLAKAHAGHHFTWTTEQTGTGTRIIYIG